MARSARATRSTAASTPGEGEKAVRASRLTMARSYQARQYVLLSVDGQTAVCFAASSHWTIRSARRSGTRGSPRRCARIAPERANGRLETTEKVSDGHPHRSTSTSTISTFCSGFDASSRPASSESSSSAITCAPECASGRVIMPLPAPTSTTTSPGPTPAPRTSSSASRLLRRKCWPGAPALGRRTATDEYRRHVRRSLTPLRNPGNRSRSRASRLVFL